MNAYNQDSPAYYEAYRQAEKTVKDRMGFYWHLASYVTVNGFLILIYLITSLSAGDFYYPWFIWPLGAWGIGLLLNFLGVFVLRDTPASQQQRISREMERMGYIPPISTQLPPTSSVTNNPTSTPSQTRSSSDLVGRK